MQRCALIFAAPYRTVVSVKSVVCEASRTFSSAPLGSPAPRRPISARAARRAAARCVKRAVRRPPPYITVGEGRRGAVMLEEQTGVALHESSSGSGGDRRVGLSACAVGAMAEISAQGRSASWRTSTSAAAISRQLGSLWARCRHAPVGVRARGFFADAARTRQGRLVRLHGRMGRAGSACVAAAQSQRGRASLE